MHHTSTTTVAIAAEPLTPEADPASKMTALEAARADLALKQRALDPVRLGRSNTADEIAILAEAMLRVRRAEQSAPSILALVADYKALDAAYRPLADTSRAAMQLRERLFKETADIRAAAETAVEAPEALTFPNDKPTIIGGEITFADGTVKNMTPAATFKVRELHHLDDLPEEKRQGAYELLRKWRERQRLAGLAVAPEYAEADAAWSAASGERARAARPREKLYDRIMGMKARTLPELLAQVQVFASQEGGRVKRTGGCVIDSWDDKMVEKLLGSFTDMVAAASPAAAPLALTNAPRALVDVEKARVVGVQRLEAAQEVYNRQPEGFRSEEGERVDDAGLDLSDIEENLMRTRSTSYGDVLLKARLAVEHGALEQERTDSFDVIVMREIIADLAGKAVDRDMSPRPRGPLVCGTVSSDGVVTLNAEGERRLAQAAA